MWSAVGVNGNGGFSDGLGCDHPRLAVPPGDCHLDADDLANQADKVLQKLLWRVSGIDLVAYFEQGSALFAAKPPAAWPGLIG
jgi:hypothetical protein